MSLSDYLENAWLNSVRGGGTSFTAPAKVWMSLATGAPGEAGTANAFGDTTRQEVTFGAASGGQIALSNTPSWVVSASGTVSHFALWDASTAGNCLGSGALDSPVTVSSGDTLNLTGLTWSLD